MRTAVAISTLAPILAACAAPERRGEAARAFDLDLYQAHVRTLSSDAFGGRAPGSPGEEQTVRYLEGELARLGLEPGCDGSYRQEVPLVEITADPGMELVVTGGAEHLRFAYGEDFMAGTRRADGAVHGGGRVALEHSPLVFAGYGIVAPEYGWNDYADIDVSGKTVIVLVNDPGFATQDDDLFRGNAMTYYGRWTYKYEEAARQGAAGALIVHETRAASYPWEVVTGGWSGPQFDLPRGADAPPVLEVEGWLQRDAARALLLAAGKDLEGLELVARRRGFRPLELGLAASIAIDFSVRESVSHNVVARLPGRTRPDEHVVYTAHWDHLGTDPALEREGDGIYNGALDNATGTAGLLALAGAFARLEPRPERSLLFLAVTAEESGLLGSRHYADRPCQPLETTVAAINMDGLNVYGRTRDVPVVGYGSSELEELLERVADAQGREIVPDREPEKGTLYRSDHVNFAKRGVPVLYLKTGVDFVDGRAEERARRRAEYVDLHYHKPSDEVHDFWDWRGPLQDLELLFEVGHRLATSPAFPNWYEGSEFRAVRDQSRAARAGP